MENRVMPIKLQVYEMSIFEIAEEIKRLSEEIYQLQGNNYDTDATTNA